jgi:hypothetical protein
MTRTQRRHSKALKKRQILHASHRLLAPKGGSLSRHLGSEMLSRVELATSPSAYALSRSLNAKITFQRGYWTCAEA